jgi:ATP-dependent protease HslVU (ClpYQ) peptidase subunit
MTWVVGATSVFGYGALYSDIQVTFADGTTRDLVQKTYPITNFIAAGFAGSVQIGVSLLQSLADCTRLPDQALATQAWDPI